jgi:hypothetical protein
MTFDIAVGMSGDQLNATAAAVYTAVYPAVFTGTYHAKYLGTEFSIAVDVQAPPQFSLGASQPPEAVAAALTARLAADPRAADSPSGPPGGDGPESDTASSAAGGLASDASAEEIIAAVAATFPTFEIILPTVGLTFSNGTKVQLTLALTAQCYLENGPNTISFVPYAVTAAKQQDPVTDYLVQHAVLPNVLTMLTQLLSGVTIPPIQVSGIALSQPSVGIAGDYVIAAANLAASGTPPPPDGSFAWPGTPFFALLGPNVIQQLGVIAAASATNNFSNSGSGGDFWGGYEWGYGLSLTSPSATIQGNGIGFAFTLRGTVSAGFHVIGVPIDLGFDAYAEPNPSASAAFSVEGDQLVLTAQSVAAFTIFCLPNSVPGWVLGWLVTAVVNAVTVTLTPLVTVFLRDIRLASYQVPTYTVSVAGKSLQLTPTNLTVGNVAGTIGLTGSATITPG